MENYVLEILLQLVILFAVIFDPPASLAVFVTATQLMDKERRQRIATYAIMVAVTLSVLVLIFGNLLLTVFSTTIDEFRIAGGIVLGILGIKMALGIPLHRLHETHRDKGEAIAAIIGTPLLTGPAAITSIILSTNDFGIILTGTSVAIVLFVTAVMFYSAEHIYKILGKTSIQIISTVLGLITLAWAVKFITVGLKVIF
jgi:multiple antibiotic resistance protein